MEMNYVEVQMNPSRRVPTTSLEGVKKSPSLIQQYKKSSEKKVKRPVATQGNTLNPEIPDPTYFY